MAETVFYMRGPFPFGPERSVPDGFIRDVKVLTGIEPNLLASFSADLQKYPGFLDEQVLSEVCSKYFKDKDTAEAMGRLIPFIYRRMKVTNESATDFLDVLKEWLSEKENEGKNLLSTADVSKLETRLPIVIQRFPGLERRSKAETLSQATGLPLKNIDLICDIRPIFDQDRERIEGFIPLTTLRLTCTGADGLPVAFETTLSNSDVTRLATAAEFAVKKLRRLRELASAQHIAIPHIEFTEEGKKHEQSSS